MLAKIRLQAQATLWEELQSNPGKGADGWCCSFMHISYAELKKRVLEGVADEEIYQWCQEHVSDLNDADKLVWKHFSTKPGWNDIVSPVLMKRKAENGLKDRDDIMTMPHFIDVDEDRRP